MRARSATSIVVALLLALLALIAAPLPVSADGPAPPPFVIIVDPSNAGKTYSRKFLADAFLKKTTRWPNGDLIRPVDLSADSPVREKFSQDILKRSVAAVKSYWQQVIFSGRGVPPPELANDDEVVKYVLANNGAVGYVSGAAKLGNAKVVTLE